MDSNYSHLQYAETHGDQEDDMLALLREIDEPSETVSEYIHNDVTSGQLLLTQPFVPTFSTAMDSPTVVSFAPVEVLSRDLSIPMQPLDLPYANLDNTSYPSTKGVGEEQDHTDSTNWQTATDMLALQLFDDHSDDSHTGLNMDRPDFNPFMGYSYTSL